jgi:hypothetical protein
LFTAGLIIFGYVLLPRSSGNLLTIFLALLASFGLIDILGLLEKKQQEEATSSNNYLPRTQSSRLFFGFVLIYVFIGAFTYKYTFDKTDTRLTTEDYRAISWIGSNTIENENILVYPPSGMYRFWWNDYLSEWLPALSDRKSVSTVQGYEWLPGMFDQKVLDYVKLRFCPEIGPVCVENWEKEIDYQIDYVLIQETQNNPDRVNSFIADLRYQLVFQGDSLVIFKKEK